MLGKRFELKDRALYPLPFVLFAHAKPVIPAIVPESQKEKIATDKHRRKIVSRDSWLVDGDQTVIPVVVPESQKIDPGIIA